MRALPNLLFLCSSYDKNWSAGPKYNIFVIPLLNSDFKDKRKGLLDYSSPATAILIPLSPFPQL
jgi:hypothetical protein